MTGDKKGLMRGQSDYFYWLQKERSLERAQEECAMPWSRPRVIFSSNKKDGHPPEVCGGVRQKERFLDEMHVCKMRWVYSCPPTHLTHLVQISRKLFQLTK